MGVEDASKDWRFVRSETLEILGALNNKQLLFKPEGDKWQPVYYQFACMARTQMVYAKAMGLSKMDFKYFGDDSLPDKHAEQTVEGLKKLLNSADSLWLKALDANKDGVKWPGRQMPTYGHVSRLIAHERMHHGLLIAYFTLAGWELPPKFKKNWAL